jgi:hypothetical protein
MSRNAFWALAIAVVSTACGSSSPSAPSDSPGTTPQPFTLTGRVVGTVTGEAIAGATVTFGGTSLVTDADGAFSVSRSSAGVEDVVVTRDGLITRSARLAVFGRDVTIDVIQDRLPFDLDFFRRLARNAFQTESGLEPLRPLSRAPRIHLRTVDQAGREVDAATLGLVEAALRDAAPVWSDGRLPIQVVERGPGTRQGQEGWVTVLWIAEAEDGVCGRATLGTSTGYIELNYLSSACTCGRPARIAPRTVRHELGHVYGYWHTGNLDDLMAGLPWSRRLCDQRPSAREAEHAKYMYMRTAGNLDPDTDPAGHVLRTPRPVVIED